jgi:hypothetical protein
MNRPVTLHDLTSADKEKLMKMIGKRTVRAGIIYLPIFLIVGWVVIYVNNNYETLGIYQENVRGTISVVGVLISLLALRLFANYVIAHGKAARGWQKKILNGEITGIKNNKVFAVGQEFEVPSELLKDLKPGDEISAEISVAGNHLIHLEKRTTQAAEETAPAEEAK